MATDTFLEVRWFPNEPYLRFFAPNLRIHLGSLLPTVTAFLLQRTKEWGDPTPFDLTGYTMLFRLHDKNRNLVVEGPAIKGPTFDDTGEILYEWKEFDIQQAGTYYGEFVLVKTNKDFIVPNSNNRLYISVIS
jgi:hypothetical protein